MSLPMSSLLSPCLRGMRRNLLPGILLQCLALSTILLYTFWPGFHAWLNEVGALKQQYGYTFSGLGTAIFGGLIPYLVLLLTRQLATDQRLSVLLFYVGFWLWKGVEVDAFYRLQAIAFGAESAFATIAKKAAIDQFVYNPLWAAPTQTLFFLWKDSRFSWSVARTRLVEEPLLRRVVVVLLSSWVVWIPTVSIVYALPSALQIPLFNLVVCFWSLLMTSVTQRHSA
jgi:hypothetical protein